MLDKIGRKFQPDFQANINLNLWFNFKLKNSNGGWKVNERSRLFKLCGSTTRNLNLALKDTTQTKGNSFFLSDL